MAGHSVVVLNEEDVPGVKLTNDPIACNNEELKRWLECHGLKKSGKKQELIEKVRLSIGKIKVDPKIDVTVANGTFCFIYLYFLLLFLKLGHSIFHHARFNLSAVLDNHFSKYQIN